jgi:hypothetical protein
MNCESDSLTVLPKPVVSKKSELIIRPRWKRFGILPNKLKIGLGKKVKAKGQRA